MLNYLREVKNEFKNIRWLRMPRVTLLTTIVLIASLTAGFFLGFLDNAFQYILNTFI